MMYVEWLRVRNCLKCLAIVLGVILVIGLILRIGLNKQLDIGPQIISQFTTPGTVRTDSTLPNGISRVTLRDAARNRTITIDKNWEADIHVVVTEPRSETDDHLSFNVGSIQATETENGGMRTTIMDTDGPTQFYWYLTFAALVGLILATCMAAPFARERDGHLEIALTRPVSRLAYGLSTIAVDLAGIMLGMAMTVVALIAGQTMYEIPHIAFDPRTGYLLIGVVLFPAAWYALLCAATASLSRGYGAVIGFAWPASGLMILLGVGKLGDSALGLAVHNIFWVISRFNPLTYCQTFGVDISKVGEITLKPDYWTNTLIVLALFVIYSALAVFQWRRAEA